MSVPKPVVLCILDGWGLSPDRDANAVALAATPNVDRIMQGCPSSTLTACGTAVGLPEGQMGNSEVGHMNIGAGRVVWMDLPRINNAIADGSFAENKALAEFVARLKVSGGRAHIAGLVSNGGVHSHSDHVLAAARAMTAAGVQVQIHVFTDGRDVPPSSAKAQLFEFEQELPEGATIVSVCGRFYAMDRDNRWDRVKAAYQAIAFGAGRTAHSLNAALDAAYARGETDEFIEPTIIGNFSGAFAGDGLFFTNFRADRARELLSSLLDPYFDGFEIRNRPRFEVACGMVEYSEAHNRYMSVMFPSADMANTLGAGVAAKGRTQFRLAETEKYPHVTFFFNGGAEEPNPGEDRYMAPSPKVRTYDMAPEMSAAEVTEQFVGAIQGGAYDLIIVNYANPDMVGHTGDLQAAMQACEAVDRGVGAVLAALEKAGGAMILTADHGNCDVMVDPETGEAHTAHTLNPVPVVMVGGPAGATLADGGKLADLAPSLLELMELEKPAEMTGESLIRR